MANLKGFLLKLRCPISRNLSLRTLTLPLPLGMGSVKHEIRIKDGSSTPFCTQEALKDHLGELGTATDIKSEVNVVFDSPCDEYAKERYDDFRDLMAKNYTNVEIRYPWDDVKE